MAKTGLGKGLGALIGMRPEQTTVAAPALDLQMEVESGDRVQTVDVSTVVPSPMQPRREFAAEALQELMDSIRQHGIIQPLIVRLVQRPA